MTTIDIEDGFPEAAGRRARAGIIRRWFANWQRRRVQRIALNELSSMDNYLLRDKGIEPQDVIDAMTGRDSSLLFNPVRKRE